MKRTYTVIQKILSQILLAVFLFALMPHEFIHDEIARHKDTVDLHHSHDAVSPHHIHCKFLQVVLAPYLAGQVEAVNPVQHAYCVFRETPVTFFGIKRLYYNTLRGPPAFSKSIIFRFIS